MRVHIESSGVRLLHRLGYADAGEKPPDHASPTRSSAVSISTGS
jgi:hypothetical protein